MLAQNLKRIAAWSERPLRCLALSAATAVMAFFIDFYFFIVACFDSLSNI